MPHSGIKASDDVRRKYAVVHKKNKKGFKLPYAVFKFSDDLKEVVVDYDSKYYEKHHTYSELVGLLPDNSPRYFCYDFPHLNKDGGKSTAVIFVSWFPVKTPVKQKFLAGSTSLPIAEALNVPKKHYLEGEDLTDIDEASVCRSSGGGWKPCPQDLRDPMPECPVAIDTEDTD